MNRKARGQETSSNTPRTDEEAPSAIAEIYDDPLRKREQRTVVFIDGQNFMGAMQKMGLRPDFQKLYDYLVERFDPLHCFFFCVDFSQIGDEAGLRVRRGRWFRFSEAIRRAGFKLRVRKAVVVRTEGGGSEVKGDQDIQIVTDALYYLLQNEVTRFVFVTGDCDFAYFFETLSGPPLFVETILFAQQRSKAELKQSVGVYYPLNDVAHRFGIPRQEDSSQAENTQPSDGFQNNLPVESPAS